MINFAKLTGFRKGIRPVQPESFPAFVDRELEGVGNTTRQIVEAVQLLGTGMVTAGLTNAANDAAAATAGVAINAFYRNGSVLMIRVA